MVAALSVARHVVASRSAAGRKTAARSSQGQRRPLGAGRGRGLDRLRDVLLGPALCQSASTWPWSCGITAFAVSPLRTSRPPITSGISIRSPAMASRRALSSALSGDPGA